LEEQILKVSEVTKIIGSVEAEKTIVLESINQTFGTYIYKNIRTLSVIKMALNTEKAIEFPVTECNNNQLKQLIVKCGDISIKTIYLKCGRFPKEPWTYLPK